jgi:hypothetical protein
MGKTKLQVLGVIGCCCALVLAIHTLVPVANSQQGRILSDYELRATFGGSCPMACTLNYSCPPWPNQCQKSGDYWYKWKAVNMLKIQPGEGSATNNAKRVCARYYKYDTDWDCNVDNNGVPQNTVMCEMGCDGITTGCT